MFLGMFLGREAEKKKAKLSSLFCRLALQFFDVCTVCPYVRL